MRLIAAVVLMLMSVQAWSQKGYVKLDNDSVYAGYIKFYQSNIDGHKGFEVWKKKSDRKPQRFPKEDIIEYAIDQDTFKVFKNLKSHNSEKHYRTLDAKKELNGKINLYAIVGENALVLTPIPVAIPYETLLGYVVEDPKTGHTDIFLAKNKDVYDRLLPFFPERYLVRYQEEYKEVTFKTLPHVVKLYNSK